MTHQGADSPVTVQALQSLGNVTLLERPTRVSALVSAVRSALRARHRQHQTRLYLQERERTAAALRDADRRKDEFLATLAHDLRNPLSPISNALEILRLSGNADPGAQPVLEMMERQVNHLVRLVDDLLDVSRITLGKMVLRRAPIAIGDVLETGDRVEPAAGRVAPPPARDGDPAAAARRRRRRGAARAGVREPASTTPPSTPTSRARSSCRCAGRARRSSCRCATTASASPRRCSGACSRSSRRSRGLQGRAGGGLGIGLTLVRSLVAMHGGNVAVVSEGRGKGSEFVVRLPLSVASEPRSAAPRHAPAGAAAQHRVLVVDDNVDAAESLGMVLDLLGAEVRVVNSGSDALATMASTRRPSSCSTSGCPAWTATRSRAASAPTAATTGVTLIAMTGWGQDEDRKRTRAEGFDHHLIKPPDIVALQTVLASVDGGRGRARVAHA
jgi:CheY-like chemotaxis protein